MTFQSQLDTDATAVFLNADEFAESFTYTFEDGTTRAITGVFVEMVGALDAVQQGTFYVHDNTTTGVASPKRGEKITRNGEVWTVMDSKEDLGVHAIKCVLPIERN